MADKKKKVFEHESLQKPSGLGTYLRALAEGFEKGELTVSGQDGDIVLEPNGLVTFEVRVSQRPDRSRMNLRLTWKPRTKPETGSFPSLRITPGSDGDADGEG